jgi:hypothetical protein
MWGSGRVEREVHEVEAVRPDPLDLGDGARREGRSPETSMRAVG